MRTAVALAALTGTPLRLFNVRARRPRPGLAAQHLAAVQAVAAVCDARCEGLALRTTEFSFEPGAAVAGGERRIDVGTAGSVTLVLQALVPVLLGAREPSRVVVTGGTDVPQAPTWDYFREVLLALLARMNLSVHADLRRRGYYPKGGGEVVVGVEPGIPAPLVLSGGDAFPAAVRGAAHAALLPASVAERMRDSALDALPRCASIALAEGALQPPFGPGGAITLWCAGDHRHPGSSRVAERGVRAEALGRSAGSEMAADLASGAALDEHAADQVLVYMALARRRCSFSTRAVSSHARTAMWLLPQFLPVRFAAVPEGTLWRVSSEPVS